MQCLHRYTRVLERYQHTHMKALTLTFRSQTYLYSSYSHYKCYPWIKTGDCANSKYARLDFLRLHFVNRKMSVRIFEEKDHANLYAQYRPTYPDSVYETIITFYKEGKGPSCNFGLAIDVGCGNGQSTQPLTHYFRNVIGTDVSVEQVSAGNHLKNDRLDFRVGKGEDLSFLENDSVDLVTVAQAFHWFDVGQFYDEVTRVLKPGGTLAVYGYALAKCDRKEAQELLLKFHTDLLGSYWDAGRRHVDNMYSEFSLPFPDWKRMPDGDLCIQRSMPIDAYIGYLSTFSSWRKYLKRNPDSDYLDNMKQRLMDIYTKPTEDIPNMNVTWPVFMLIGRKPIMYS